MVKIKIFLIFTLVAISALFLISCQGDEVDSLVNGDSALSGQATMTKEERVCRDDLKNELRSNRKLLDRIREMSNQEREISIQSQVKSCLTESSSRSDGQVESETSCIPYECVYQEYAGGIKDCGIINDGCGGFVNCNYQEYAGGLECPSNEVCVNNLCQ